MLTASNPIQIMVYLASSSVQGKGLVITYLNRIPIRVDTVMIMPKMMQDQPMALSRPVLKASTRVLKFIPSLPIEWIGKTA
jgi:hypothetical protein